MKYIVERTVGPVLHAAIAALPPDADDATRAEAILALNVLDPAMGSGHFLVEATEFIARFLVDRAVAPGREAGDEADPSLLEAPGGGACIYGTDLNPLAVDLAKLSLWLATVAEGRPLSFLDHHLRPGNALVGARLADLGVGERPTPKPKAGTRERRAAATGQTTMFADDAFRRALSQAVDYMWLIEEPGETVAEVKEQERVYLALRADLNRRYERLANLATARHFGLAADANTYALLTKHALGETLAVPARFTGLLAQTDALATARHFFHWELEFPEVFFDRLGQPLGDAAGFDAVVGNPPYIRQEDLAPFKPCFADQYAEVYHGVADIFVYFFGQGVRLLRRGGLLAHISSNGTARANYATPLRAFLRDTTTVETIIDLGDNPRLRRRARCLPRHRRRPPRPARARQRRPGRCLHARRGPGRLRHPGRRQTLPRDHSRPGR